jgi:hypothetical protein
MIGPSRATVADVEREPVVVCERSRLIDEHRREIDADGLFHAG